MNRFFKTIMTVCVIYFASAMIISPHACIDTAKNSVELCLNVVIPSLFPFMVCSNLFIHLGMANMLSRNLSPIMRPLFGISGGGALAVILGFLSGYPIGASTATNLYQSGCISKSDAERLLAFCNNSGPLFVLGAVGVGMMHSRNAGLFLYVIHILSALITGIIFKRYHLSNNCERLLPSAGAQTSKDIASAVGTSIANSVDAIFKVCGFVIFFSVFCTTLPNSPLTPFVYSLLEITGGVKHLLNSSLIPSNLLLPVISFFMALSGVSIMLQTSAIVLPADLSMRPYVHGKFVQASLAFVLALIGQKIFPVTYLTSLNFTYPIPISTLLSPKVQFISFFLSFVVSTLVVAILYFIVLIIRHFDNKK